MCGGSTVRGWPTRWYRAAWAWAHAFQQPRLIWLRAHLQESGPRQYCAPSWRSLGPTSRSMRHSDSSRCCLRTGPSGPRLRIGTKWVWGSRDGSREGLRVKSSQPCGVHTSSPRIAETFLLAPVTWRARGVAGRVRSMESGSRPADLTKCAYRPEGRLDWRYGECTEGVEEEARNVVSVAVEDCWRRWVKLAGPFGCWDCTGFASWSGHATKLGKVEALPIERSTARHATQGMWHVQYNWLTGRVD